VKIYRTIDCSGPIAAQADATTFTAPGIQITVPQNTTSALSATATDRAGNVSDCSTATTYTEDSTPPTTTILTGPSGATDDPTPTFAFTSNDPTASAQCSLDNAPYTPCASPLTTPALPEGAHTFTVGATDNAGNTDPTPATRAFTVDTSAPIAVITATPNPALTGEPVHFDASASSDPPAGTITRYQWDLDNDGTYETDTGTNPTTTHTYKVARSFIAKVRVTSGFQRSVIAFVPLSVRAHPPRGHVGVTINNAAKRTSTRKVTLSLVWPRLAQTMTISSRADFRNARPVDVTPTSTWRLSASGSATKKVYVRFDNTRTVYSDTIVLGHRKRR